jgi:hypothetical protein
MIADPQRYTSPIRPEMKESRIDPFDTVPPGYNTFRAISHHHSQHRMAIHAVFSINCT